MNRQNHPKSLNKSYCRCMFGNLSKTSTMAPFFGGCGSMVFFLSIESMGIPKFISNSIFLLTKTHSIWLSEAKVFSQAPGCRKVWLGSLRGGKPTTPGLAMATVETWKRCPILLDLLAMRVQRPTPRHGPNYFLSWGRPQIGWKLWWYLSTGDLFDTIQSTNMENHLDSSDKLRIPGWIPWCFLVSRVDFQTPSHNPSAPAGSHGRCGRRTLESSAQSPPFQNGSVLEKCGFLVQNS